MNQKFVVEDSSFVVALMDEHDPLYEKAQSAFSLIQNKSDNIKIVIPTPVIFETLFALIRKRIPLELAQEKLWNLLMIDEVFNYPIIETSALRLGKKTAPLITKLPEDSMLPAL